MQLKFSPQQYAELCEGFLTLISPNSQQCTDLDHIDFYGADSCNITATIKYLLNTGTDPVVITLAFILVIKATMVVADSLNGLVCPQKVFIAALISSNIMFEDDTIVFRKWQQLAGFTWTLDQLKYMTIELFRILQFQMNIDLIDFNDFKTIFNRFILGKSVYKEIKLYSHRFCFNTQLKYTENSD
ncbi:hypothetical protein SS50377_28182 [Spironucleus salmonicida]|uniref:Cyclin n=1 Tax=Spironucleus salmonicida TaxID=348837 RepID=V6LZU4_9EUKA|nr:hypothetical protein SS50377_28182 [Spironucleus salmonicida]|eukprot:EST46374.1 Hypothetical protein SS50377_13617 [Spironucleus salmonicida]